MAQSQPVKVAHVRSFDHHVHLTMDNGQMGWSLLNDAFAHGIAAALDVTDKKGWFTYTSFDPNALGGAGFFSGVQIAVAQF